MSKFGPVLGTGSVGLVPHLLHICVSSFSYRLISFYPLQIDNRLQSISVIDCYCYWLLSIYYSLLLLIIEKDTWGLLNIQRFARELINHGLVKNAGCYFQIIAIVIDNNGQPCFQVKRERRASSLKPWGRGCDNQLLVYLN